MRIAQLAANMETVPPAGYGGTELVVNLLTEELVKRGHEVTLFAVGTSKTKARLVTVVDEPLRASTRYLATQWPAFDLQTLVKLKDMEDEFDIVHNHMSWTSLPVLDSLNCAVVTTNHNQVKGYCAPLYLRFKHLPYVAISNSYKQLNYPDEMNYVATIYNGIDVDAFNGSVQKREFLLFVGRLCNDKGTAEAIDIAKKLDMPIKIAGKVDKNDEPYFDKEIKPRLSYKKAEFVGEVNHDQKNDLYHKAIALVYPINFSEPFGLVMAEAMASGTPVMAFDKGSVREVLSDDTAVIGSSVDDLVKGFSQVEKLDRTACKKRVRDLFSVKTMVDSYEQLYERLIADKRKNRL